MTLHTTQPHPTHHTTQTQSQPSAKRKKSTVDKLLLTTPKHDMKTNIRTTTMLAMTILATTTKLLIIKQNNLKIFGF